MSQEHRHPPKTHMILFDLVEKIYHENLGKHPKTNIKYDVRTKDAVLTPTSLCGVNVADGPVWHVIDRDTVLRAIKTEAFAESAVGRIMQYLINKEATL